jgi:hypothetical protein
VSMCRHGEIRRFQYGAVFADVRVDAQFCVSLRPVGRI